MSGKWVKRPEPNHIYFKNCSTSKLKMCDCYRFTFVVMICLRLTRINYHAYNELATVLPGAYNQRYLLRFECSRSRRLMWMRTTGGNLWLDRMYISEISDHTKDTVDVDTLLRFPQSLRRQLKTSISDAALNQRRLNSAPSWKSSLSSCGATYRRKVGRHGSPPVSAVCPRDFWSSPASFIPSTIPVRTSGSQPT